MALKGVNYKINFGYADLANTDIVKQHIAQYKKSLNMPNAKNLLSLNQRITAFENYLNSPEGIAQKQKEVNDEQSAKNQSILQIQNKPNISPNPLNQLGESIEPITTQLKKPENQGLLLIAGLVAAAIIIN